MRDRTKTMLEDKSNVDSEVHVGVFKVSDWCTKQAILNSTRL